MAISNLKSPMLLRRRRHGFTFTEILFAVMILGIGFIMVAAMFPVAIRQTEETVQETTASAVAKSGSSYASSIGIPLFYPPSSNNGAYFSAYFPPTNGLAFGFMPSPLPTQPASVQFPAINSDFWSALSGNLICPSDPRYAYVPVYSRTVTVNPANNQTVPAPYAQVTFIAVQCRNNNVYTVNDLAPFNGYPPNLQARLLTATFANGGTGPDLVQFSPDGSPFTAIQNGAFYQNATGCIAEGCYIVIGDDSQTQLASIPQTPKPTCNGYIYRVGNQNIVNNTSTGYWELMPGNDMKNARYFPAYGIGTASAGQNPIFSAPVRVWVVGRGYDYSAVAGSLQYNGPAMDVAAFTTFVKTR